MAKERSGSRSSESAEVTEERRRLILWCLWIHGAGNPASINALLERHIAAGRIVWPKAPWHGAVLKPYETGTRQHLDAMLRKKDRRVIRARDALWDWNPEVLQPRAHALEVLQERRRGMTNGQISEILQISEGLISALYHDPFGFKEKVRKARYCAGCGARKDAEQTVCTNCIKKKRLEREDRAESLLPDPEWAHGLSLMMKVDFCISSDFCRILVVHTERGRIERQLLRGESWEHALEELGVLRS